MFVWCVQQKICDPTGYDLDSLFIDFKTRKQQRDLERGSKKAHKALVKEMRKRQEERRAKDEKTSDYFRPTHMISDCKKITAVKSLVLFSM